MKKYILITLILGLNIYTNAQSDAFFSYQYERREDDDNEWSELIMLPPVHGLDYNYPANEASLGTGLLIMTGMGLTYIKHRKRKTLSKDGTSAISD